jgi:hypothetical protein
MATPSSSTSWVLALCGAVLAAAAVAFFLVLDSGNAPGVARFLSGRSAPAEPSFEPELLEEQAKGELDLSPEALTGAEKVGGGEDAHRTAERVLARASEKALALNEKAQREGATATIKDFDGKNAIELKPRAVPRGPLGFLTLTTVNPASVTVAEGNESLGQTPLNNVPVLVGKHAFRLLDNRGVPRRLELEFEHGQTLERLKLDVAALPRWSP